MLRPLKNNSGMSITSVVVAFGILVTACILFTKGMQMSTNMITMADDEKDGIEDSMERYYNDRASEPTSEVEIEFKDSSDPGIAVFTLKAPVAKTEPETYSSGKTKEYSYGFQFFSSNKARGVEPAPETPAGP